MVDCGCVSGIDSGDVVGRMAHPPRHQRSWITIAGRSNDMIESLLRRTLEPVARCHRRLQSRRRLALCWAAAAVAGLLLLLLQQTTGIGGTLPKILVAAGAALAGIIIWSRSQRWQPDYRQIARQIEEHH